MVGKKGKSDLTHKVFVVIVIWIIHNPMAISLVESAEATNPKPLTINSRSALEASLPKTFIQTFAQRSACDLRMEFATQFAVSISLESGVWPSAISKKVGRH